MRSLILSIAVSSSIFNVPLHANSQEAMTPTARLHFSLPFPAGFKGRFEISAASAQRTQSSTGAGTVLELSGDVEVVMINCRADSNICDKSPVILHAHAVAYDENSGEIEAHGAMHAALSEPVRAAR